MNPKKPFLRFLLGAAIVLVVVIAAFAWIGAVIPTWGSMPEEVTRSLPADDQVPINLPNMTFVAKKLQLRPIMLLTINNKS